MDLVIPEGDKLVIVLAGIERRFGNIEDVSEDGIEQDPHNIYGSEDQQQSLDFGPVKSDPAVTHREPHQRIEHQVCSGKVEQISGSGYSLGRRNSDNCIGNQRNRTTDEQKQDIKRTRPPTANCYSHADD